jgi:phage-related protein
MPGGLHCGFKEAVYVLHCFQKKSKTGIAAPKPEIDLIKMRLKQAEAHAKEANHERDRKKRRQCI